MKTQLKFPKRLLLLFLLSLSIACSKDSVDTENNTQTDNKLQKAQSNIDTDEFETDKGQLGISISTRSLKRKGYNPTKAVFTINDGEKSGDYEVDVDPYTNLAFLSFENKNLSENAKSELESGVALNVKVVREDGNELAAYSSSKTSFKSSPNDIEIDDQSKPDLKPITLDSSVDYYVQILNQTITSVWGAPSATRRTSTTDLSTEVKVRRGSDLNYISDKAQTIPFTKFRFELLDASQNIYNIYNPNGSKKHYIYIDGKNGNRLNVQSEANYKTNGGNTPPSKLGNNYKFQIKQIDIGKYIIISMSTGLPLIANTNYDRMFAKATSTPSYFRILNFEIEWDIQSIGTKFLNPILPPSKTEAAYNTALKNCSSGTLSQSVGFTKEETRTDTYEWSESIQVATTVESSLSTTVSSTVEANVGCEFFGASNSVTASATAEVKVGHSSTETRTESKTTSTSETIKLSSERQITVPPGKGTSAADIYQVYENIKVPYVQMYRIRAKYKNGSSLDGSDIMTQFNFNGSSGVITETGSDFIEINVKGYTVIDKLIQTSTETRDIPNACN
ncbi:hypothetical protein VOI54_10355 [Tamlana sp. 2201CG12-4]|uniref:hypothetical protein n=1 Tax=Tamlana sp. 2201CG12-4 TaxID=3112582 RepID=UPI002DBF46F9|nr:hypothetical protein [Tamlana sp. 2201CG12-4]MEC3907421.1 hypothetical protein [Tamlana sp. 2201CG12-4]